MKEDKESETPPPTHTHPQGQQRCDLTTVYCTQLPYIDLHCAELRYLAVLLVLLKADGTVEIGQGAGVVDGRCLGQVTDGQVKGFDVILQCSPASTHHQHEHMQKNTCCRRGLIYFPGIVMCGLKTSRQ